MSDVSQLDPESIKGIARHVRAMVASVKRRPKNRLELAYALAAAKIVVATLERACAEAQIPGPVLEACDELAADSRRVMELVRWR